MFIVRKKTTEKPDSLAEYNIIGSLSGLGPGILIHALHEMRDPADAQAFLTTSRSIARLRRHPLFKWSISQIISITYTLTTIPLERVDLVCRLPFQDTVLFCFNRTKSLVLY